MQQYALEMQSGLGDDEALQKPVDITTESWRLCESCGAWQPVLKAEGIPARLSCVHVCFQSAGEACERLAICLESHF